MNLVDINLIVRNGSFFEKVLQSLIEVKIKICVARPRPRPRGFYLLALLPSLRSGSLGVKTRSARATKYYTYFNTTFSPIFGVSNLSLILCCLTSSKSIFMDMSYLCAPRG